MENKYRYITKIDRNCQIYKRKHFTSNKVNETEIMVLHYIRHHEGTNQDSISKYLEVDKGLVTRMIKHLIELDLVTKKSSDTDKRENLIYSTEKAKQMKIESNELEEKFYDYLFEDLDKEEIDCFLNVLEKIYVKSKKARKSDYEEIK